MAADEARIAYLLLVHKLPEQVNQLLSQILCSDEDSDAYVHIDKRNFEALSHRLMKHPRVNILKASVEVHWGDISLVDSSLMLLRAALNSGKSYDFVTLRSGQDLIIRTGLNRYLADYRGKSFLTARRVPREDRTSALPTLQWPRCMRELYDSPHPIRMLRTLLIRLYGLGIRPMENPDKLPDSVQLHHGSSWFCMAMDHARFVLDYLDEHPWFYRAFQNALIPDEWFYQTLAMNSRIAPDVINRNLTFLRWGTTMKDRHHPVTWTTKDIPEIEACEDFFARKFDIGVDSDVINYFVAKTNTSRARSPANANSAASSVR